MMTFFRRPRLLAVAGLFSVSFTSLHAGLQITNGGFEGSQFYVSPQTATSPRDFFYRGLYAANGDGWYTSNNDNKWKIVAGGAGGTLHYGAKEASANHRGVVNVITDNRQTKGALTLHANVLHRANGGTENLVVKVWGVREGTPGKWDGWIDLTGPSGNNDGLDLRNFNNALAVDNAGQTSSTAAVSYTGSDFTPLLVTNAAALGISPSDAWQPVSFNVDLGSTGYDQIVVGFAFQDTSGTPSGIDDYGLSAVLPVKLTLNATPPHLESGQQAIWLNWKAENAPVGSTYVITSDRQGYGPYDVTSSTSAGANTSPLVVDYDQRLGDVTFRLTVTDPASARTYTQTTLVTVSRPEPVLSAAPAQLTAQDHQISLTWSSANYPPGSRVAITSNRSGIGPFDVSAGTGGNGSSTAALIIPYDRPIGDVTFTITVTDPVTGLSGESALVVKAPASALPNVLVVLVDDMGWSDISPYGGEIQTPALQRLADHGLRFREFHNEARCAPTRNALLSGLHVQTSATDPNNELPPMRIDNNVTIAEMLRSVGYRTYLSGKWHLSEYMDQSKYTPLASPTHRGFDYAFNASLWGGHLADHHGLETYFNGQDFDLCPADSEIVPIRYDGTDSRASRPSFYKTDADTDYAIEYLNHHYSKNDGKPFFLYLAYNAPHFHLQSPKERINLYTDVADDTPGDQDIYRYEDGWDVTRQRRYERQLAQGVIPPGTRLPPMSPNPGGPGVPAWDSLSQTEKDDLARRMATYASMVHGIDLNIARVIARLEQQGQLDNTIIMFMSDNGGNYEGGIYGGGDRLTGNALKEMGQAGQALINIGGAWADVSNTPFRYFKHHTYEGGCRTPMIIHWPAGLRHDLEGSWTNERGHVIDIMPTLLNTVGLRYPEKFAGHAVEPLQGTSLLPVLTGGAIEKRDLTIEHERNRALYRGDWKLVTKTFSFSPNEELPADTPELYNMKNDPTEMNNQSFVRPQMLATMIGAFNAWVDRTPGLAANRRLATITAETTPFVMPVGKEFLVDLFNRPDADDIDADQTGISGTLVGMDRQPVNDVHFEGYNPSGARISGKRLRFTGMVEDGLKINLDSPLVTAAGGFSVAFDIASIISSTTTPDDYVGFGAGLTQAAAQLGGDISTPDSFRGNSSQNQGQADFFADVDASGNLRCWVHGAVVNSVPVGTAPGKLLVAFKNPGGFKNGAAVGVDVFFRGIPVYSGSFVWRKDGGGYLGFSSRSNGYTEIDNLIVAPLPLRDSFVGTYAAGFGLTDDRSAADQDPDGDGVSNGVEWMLGTDPSVADDPLRGVLTIDQADPSSIKLLHLRSKSYAQAGVSYRIRCSADLVNWTVMTPGQIDVLSESGQYEKVMLTLPESLRTAGKLFFTMELED